jgi:hypothetical protein
MSHVGGSSYESGQSSHEGQGDASGGDADVNDEDDHLHRLMKEQDVDGDADNINSDDEKNSEATPILNSWNLDYTTTMVNNDRHDSTWYYYHNNVSAHALYPDKQHL